MENIIPQFYNDLFKFNSDFLVSYGEVNDNGGVGAAAAVATAAVAAAAVGLQVRRKGNYNRENFEMPTKRSTSKMHL